MSTPLTNFGRKACLLICLPALNFCYTYGQITVTQTDMPQPGDTIRVSICNSNAGLPNPALTGTNYTWDYSNLTAFTQTVDTFLSVTSTPLAYQFYFNDAFLYPAYKSTVAQSAPNMPPLGVVTITNVINYYKDQSSNYESVGYGAKINGISTSVKDDSIDVMYVFPMNYGNSDSCNSKSQVSIPSLGYYATHQKRINHVDGWGTLKTPYGTFNTLRISTTLYSYDSLNIDTPVHFGFSTPETEQIQYKWFGNGFGIPLLQVNEQVVAGNPVFTSAVYRDSIRKPLLGIDELNRENSENEFRIYPNPGKGLVQIQVTNCYQQIDNSRICIYNMLGKKVYSNRYTLSASPCSIDLSAQPAGVYIYMITNEVGNLLAEGKLIILK